MKRTLRILAFAPLFLLACSGDEAPGKRADSDGGTGGGRDSAGPAGDDAGPPLDRSVVPDTLASDAASAPRTNAISTADVAVSSDLGGPSDATPASSGQLPPRERMALESWLAQGHYKMWSCERGTSARRLNGAHGRTRICSNAALVASKSGDYPVGAASVKEIYDASDRLNGYAIGLKITSGGAVASWYWYERIGTSVIADGDGTAVRLCSGCHQSAVRDHVFILAE